MARRVPNQAKENNAHYRRSARYVAMLNGVYKKATDEATRLALLAWHTDDTPFKWADYPQTKAKLDQITRSFADDMRGVVVNGASTEWTQSNEKNDRLARAMLGVKKGEPIIKRFEQYFNHNDKALAQFISRKDKGGMNLSKRVWNLSDQLKADLEVSLSDGLSKGKSAAELSRDVRKHLNEPSKLFRRVRDDKGNLRLSNPAKAYHPGTGVYRSSYKNAQRLTRTEINMAYRNADRERWSQMDFVVGFEVKRSGRGYDCSVCSSLAGKYPKDFKFVGWHPSCRCYVIPVLKTDEEFWAWDGRGEAPTSSVNEVRDVPSGFKGWVDKNSHRIDDAEKKGTLPYFLRDNQSFIKIDKTQLHPSMTKYTGAYYPRINQYLRGQRTQLDTETLNVIDEVSRYINLSDKYNGVSYRGITADRNMFDSLKSMKQGSEFTEKGFMSTSIDKLVADDFSDDAMYKVIFEIKGKRGVDISSISDMQDEKEILFDKLSKFKIIKVKTVDKKTFGNIYITMEEI